MEELVKQSGDTIERDGKVKYTFEQNKVETLRENLNRGTFENIGKFL